MYLIVIFCSIKIYDLRKISNGFFAKNYAQVLLLFQLHLEKKITFLIYLLAL